LSNSSSNSLCSALDFLTRSPPLHTKHLSMGCSDSKFSTGLRRVSKISSREFHSLHRLSSDLENLNFPPTVSQSSSYPSAGLNSQYFPPVRNLDITEEHDNFSSTPPLKPKDSFFSAIVRKVPSIDFSFSNARFPPISRPSQATNSVHHRNSSLFNTTPGFTFSQCGFNSSSVDLTNNNLRLASELDKIPAKPLRTRKDSFSQLMGRMKLLLGRKSRPVAPHPTDISEPLTSKPYAHAISDV